MVADFRSTMSKNALFHSEGKGWNRLWRRQKREKFIDFGTPNLHIQYYIEKKKNVKYAEGAGVQLRIRKLTTNGTNHTNKLRIIHTISALILDIIHIIFVFVREVGEVRGPKSELPGRSFQG
jgi:hypothetical protein